MRWQVGCFSLQVPQEDDHQKCISQFLNLVTNEILVDLIGHHKYFLWIRKPNCPFVGLLKKRLTVQWNELLGIILPGEWPQPCPDTPGKNNGFHNKPQS